MQLWAPDLFSDPVPRFASASDEAVARVHRLLGAHFRGLGMLEGEVLQPARAEVNSRNFALRTERGRYLLQCQEGSRDHLERVIGVAQWARELGLPLPRIEPADDGCPLVAFDDGVWFAMEFVEGTHFSGAGKECGSTAEVIGCLRKALAGCPPEFWPTQPTLPPGEDEMMLAGELEAARGSWEGILGADTARLLDHHWARVRAELEACVSASPQGGNDLMHFDLHPHNLIMEGGKVRALIDLASFRRCDARTFVAFGLLKLMRQAVCWSGGRDDEIQRVREVFQPALGDLDPGEAGVLARSEVVRRIFVLLGLSLREGDRSWNHVLPVHLRALDESRILFPISA